MQARGGSKIFWEVDHAFDGKETKERYFREQNIVLHFRYFQEQNKSVSIDFFRKILNIFARRSNFFSTFTSMYHHKYERNIVDCDAKQQIHQTNLSSFDWMKSKDRIQLILVWHRYRDLVVPLKSVKRELSVRISLLLLGPKVTTSRHPCIIFLRICLINISWHSKQRSFSS